MIAQIKGMVTGVLVREKKRDGVVQKDSQGRTIMERKLMILDLEDPQAESPYKVNFDADQESTVQDLLRQEVTADLTVHQFNKYTYFRLSRFVGL